MSYDLDLEADEARRSYHEAEQTRDALEEAAELASKLHDQLRLAGLFEADVREMGVITERHVFELRQRMEHWAAEVDVREMAMREADDRAEQEEAA